MIHANAAVVADFGELILDKRNILRLAVGRQAHHFVFAAVDFESGVISKGAVQQTEAVGKAQLLQQSNLVSFSDAD